jgi:hypothetical protein
MTFVIIHSVLVKHHNKNYLNYNMIIYLIHIYIYIYMMPEIKIVSVHNELLIKVQKNSRYSPCGTISNVDQLKDIMHTYSSSSDELISSSEEELSSSEDVTSSDCDSDYDYH